MPKGNGIRSKAQSSIREVLERREELLLAPGAAVSSRTIGRVHAEAECPLRTAYQRDRDRVVHCKSFRRLKHKTQVFLSPTGDHYRTRLTHTLEVSQIARTIGRALALNEDLIEAVSLAHDLGHTPFGHGGERVLDEIVPGGFNHTDQSLRVVDHLERGGQGLNLTAEVRDGIINHSKGRDNPILSGTPSGPNTLEAQVVRLADIVAYLNHDLDDAIRAEVLKESDIPSQILTPDWSSHSKRIHSLVVDIIESSAECGLQLMRMSPEMLSRVVRLREFLFERVYDLGSIRGEFGRVRKIIVDLYEYLMKDDSLFLLEIGDVKEPESRQRRVVDHIAGMTDRYALDLYKRTFLPRPWMKL